MPGNLDTLGHANDERKTANAAMPKDGIKFISDNSGLRERRKCPPNLSQKKKATVTSSCQNFTEPSTTEMRDQPRNIVQIEETTCTDG